MLGRSHTTLSREYLRNIHGWSHVYVPSTADKQYKRRAERQRYKAPLKNCFVFLYVRKRLRAGWSPECIAGRLSVDHPEESVHHETIYRYIYNAKKTRGMHLWKYLKNHRKRRLKQVVGRKVKKVHIPNRVCISQRPEAVQHRSTVGHWESDNMTGNRSDVLRLSVAVERKTRFSVLSLVGRSALEKNKSLAKLSTLHPAFIKSVTLDNGSENSKYNHVFDTSIVPVYFCNPYHSWEKGTVENTIGRIRTVLPKKHSLDSITHHEIQLIQDWMNNTPRKCLNWLTPSEALQIEYDHLQQHLLH